MNLDIISSNKSFGGWHKQYRHRSNVCWGARCASPSTCRPRPSPARKSRCSTGSPVSPAPTRTSCKSRGPAHRRRARHRSGSAGHQPRGEGWRTIPAMTSAWGRGSTSTPPRPLAGSLPDVRLRHPGAARAHRDPLPGLDEARHQRPLHGGHGALIAALREPGRYRSVSAFSPISHPEPLPLGPEGPRRLPRQQPLLWREWDACQLLRHHDSPPLPTLVDVGLDDPFLAEQLGIDTLAEVAATRAWP